MAHLQYVNESSNRYSKAAHKATEEGLRPGSHPWWNRIREIMRHNNAASLEPMEHKDHCPWKNGYYEQLTERNRDAADREIKVTDSGIEYSGNMHSTTGEENYALEFAFCPMCGVPYTRPLGPPADSHYQEAEGHSSIVTELNDAPISTSGSEESK